MSERLFVPLASDPYQWFLDGHKTWEVRRMRRQYTTRHVWPGRVVELRRGYSDPTKSIWGRISDVVEAGSLSQLFDNVDFKSVIPAAKDRDEAEAIATRILGLESAGDQIPMIGFRVSIDFEGRNQDAK